MATTTLSDRHNSPAPLHQQVGLLCHVIRVTALAWILWSLYRTVTFWGDAAEVVRGYGHFLKVDLSGLPASHHGLVFALVLADWLVGAAVVWFVWKLFGHYLRGSIFTREAVAAMRGLGWVGVLAVAADMIVRPVISFVLTMHLDNATPAHRVWGDPNDLLHLLMAFFIVALAHVYRAGVEIADDNRQIV